MKNPVLCSSGGWSFSFFILFQCGLSDLILSLYKINTPANSFSRNYKMKNNFVATGYSHDTTIYRQLEGTSQTPHKPIMTYKLFRDNFKRLLHLIPLNIMIDRRLPDNCTQIAFLTATYNSFLQSVLFYFWYFIYIYLIFLSRCV